MRRWIVSVFIVAFVGVPSGVVPFIAFWVAEATIGPLGVVAAALFVYLVALVLVTILKRYGLLDDLKIDPNTGEVYDPEQHDP